MKTQSNTISIKTELQNQAPNAFTLTAGSNTISSNSLTWTNTGDDAGVTSYEVYRNGSLVGTTAGNANSYNDTGLASSTAYSYYVNAVDGAGLKTQSNTVTMTTANKAPNEFTLSVGSSTTTSNSLTWTNTGDDVGVASYEIYRNGSFITSTSGSANSYVDSGLASATTYSYYVKAVDGTGLKTQSNTVSMTTLTVMWTINSYTNPNLTFTRNYGTDSSVTVQISTNSGASWIDSTGSSVSPRNIGSYPGGTWMRLKSMSDFSLSNVLIV